MPRFPDAVQVPAALPPAPPVLDPVAAARAAANAAALADYRNRTAHTTALVALDRLMAAQEADDQTAHKTMSEDAAGWHDQRMARFDEAVAPWIGTLPPAVAGSLQGHLGAVRGRYSNRLAAAEAGWNDAWARRSAAGFGQAAIARIERDPAMRGEAEAEFLDRLAMLPLGADERAKLAAATKAEFDDAALGASIRSHVEGGRDTEARAIASGPLAAALAEGLIARRDTDARARLAAERVAIAGLIQDDVDRIRKTGDGHPDADHHRVLSVFGEEATRNWHAARRDAAIHHANTADLALLPEAEMAARLAALDPKLEFDPANPAPPSDDDMRRQKLHGEVRDAFDRVRQLRLADPVAAVRQASHLQLLLQAADPNKPETVQALVAATLAAQVAAGLPPGSRRVLTRQEAQQLARPIIEAVHHLAACHDIIGARIATGQTHREVRRVYGPHASKALAEVHDEVARLSPALREASAGGATQSASESSQRSTIQDKPKDEKRP